MKNETDLGIDTPSENPDLQPVDTAGSITGLGWLDGHMHALMTSRFD